MFRFAQYDRVDVPLRQGGKSEGQGDIQSLLFSGRFRSSVKNHQNKQNIVMGEVNYQNPSS